ncbi:MAG: DUF4388 domain-containing protein [Vicinamibacteria bacterium]
MPVRAEIPLQGEFESSTADHDLPDILLAVCETKGTGLLTFSNPEAEKTLFVRDGSFIFAKSSAIDDRLGEYMLRSGRVGLKDLEAVSKLVKPGKRLGALLVESGVLDPKELVQSVVGQVRSIILSLFKWTKAHYEFVAQDLPSKETITLDMPTPQLIVDGIREIDSWWRISRGIGDLDSTYQAVSGTEGSLRSIELETPALELLAMLSRPKRVTEACTESSLKELDVCKLLWAFRSLGWVETVEDDGTTLLDQWDLTEDAPSPAESPQELPGGPGADGEPAPLPAMVEPIVEAVPENAVEGAPGSEDDPPFPQFDDQTVVLTSPVPGLPSIQAEPIVPSDAVEEPPPTGPIASAEPAATASQDQPVQPAQAEDPVTGPEGPDPEKPEPEAKSPAPTVGTDMDMDLDLDGLGEVLKGGKSE